MWQYIIVYIIIAAVFALLVRNAYRMFKGGSHDSGCAGCSGCAPMHPHNDRSKDDEDKPSCCH